MSFIKITDKHGELKLVFERRYELNPDHTYKLGMTKLLFDAPSSFVITNTNFEVRIKLRDGEYSISNNNINGDFTIDSLRSKFIRMIKNTMEKGIQHFKKENLPIIPEIERQKNNRGIEDLNNINPDNLVLDLSLINNNLVLILPANIEIFILKVGNFNELFNFETTDIIKSNMTYYANSKMIYPFPFIEWHCNIIEYSYANLGNNPYIHTEHELLHVSFFEKPLFPGTRYFETVKNDVKATLKTGMREIKQVKLTPLDQYGNEIILKNVVVYMQLIDITQT